MPTQRQLGLGISALLIGAIVIGNAIRGPSPAPLVPKRSVEQIAVAEAVAAVAKERAEYNRKHPSPSVEPVYVPSSRELVRAMLRDPKSADFRNEYERQGFKCGEVNAKNGFGGYTGFRRFIADRKTVLLQGEDTAFGVAWQKYCSN